MITKVAELSQKPMNLFMFGRPFICDASLYKLNKFNPSDCTLPSDYTVLPAGGRMEFG
jgi:hypothetical protein